MRVKVEETLGRAVDRLAVLQVKSSKLRAARSSLDAAGEEAARWKLAITTALDELGWRDLFFSSEALGEELKKLHYALWNAEEAKHWSMVRTLNVRRRELVSDFDARWGTFSEPYTLGKGGDDAS